MTNREALEVVKSMKIFLGGRMNGKSQLASTYNEALIRIIAMAEKAEEVREYCEKSLVHCDELVGNGEQTMTRLIDADALCEEFKERQRSALRWKEKAILDCDEEIQIRADAILSFLCEVKLTIDKAPTVEPKKGEWIKKVDE